MSADCSNHSQNFLIIFNQSQIFLVIFNQSQIFYLVILYNEIKPIFKKFIFKFFLSSEKRIAGFKITKFWNFNFFSFSPNLNTFTFVSIEKKICPTGAYFKNYSIYLNFTTLWPVFLLPKYKKRAKKRKNKLPP